MGGGACEKRGGVWGGWACGQRVVWGWGAVCGKGRIARHFVEQMLVNDYIYSNHKPQCHGPPLFSSLPPQRSAMGHRRSLVSSPTPQFQNPPLVTNGSPTIVPTLQDTTAPTSFCKRTSVTSPTLRKRQVHTDSVDADKQWSSAGDEQEDADEPYTAILVLVASNGLVLTKPTSLN
uniref:Uncharacterized protein n=1 Tax=Nelumbo nucifera TaxID=4432 RepID=A0A822ZYX1_NELNU|nr:TPA_asm: hypothetical protein HUJ06_018658 [Nelumbo nucifera]